MGLFKRGHRIAEGGGEAYAAKSEDGGGGGSGAKKAKSGAQEDLGLFGADSDESDDDATIDRYANTGAAGDDGEDGDSGAADSESKKVSVLLAKMTPEELFTRYDTDGSGNISVQEFLAMLPDLGIKMSEAKAIRIFKKCDTDGTGEIDLNEFKMAMFAVDPVSGNTLGFAPSQLLAPRDAFELFDEDGTGQIDELEFADVLEYFGMDVSDGKQEAIFKKYDKDKSGYIDYKEFRAMWIRLSNVREELEKRGVEIPKYATPWKLQRMLETILDEEEAREVMVLKEAQKYLGKQREKQKREALGRKAKVRAQDELAAALDAAGQVYVLGTGKHNQFAGLAVTRDEDLFPGFKAVSDIWAFRVDPKVPEPVVEPVKDEPTPEEQIAIAKEKAKREKEERRLAMEQERIATLKRKKARYVRRRPENKRWTFRSPPKLNVRTLPLLKGEIRSFAAKALLDEDSGDEEDRRAKADAKDENEKTPAATVVEAAKVDPTATSGEELARLFFEDREFVRSLRFKSTVIMKNTGSLWGRGVFCGALSDDVALVVARNGSVFTWGGKDKPSDSVSMQRVAMLNDDEDDVKDEGGVTQAAVEAQAEDAGIEDDVVPPVEKVTPRSAIVKMSTKHQLKNMDTDFEREAHEEQRLEAEMRQREEDEWYAQVKSVVVYYDVWEPPPSNATRIRFMEHVLVPRLDFEMMQKSARWRGLGESVVRITKMDLMLLLADCFALEREVKGENGHETIKTQEKLIQALEETKDKKLKLQLEPEKEKMLQMWEELRKLREDRRADAEATKKARELERLARTDTTFEAMVARRHVQSEDLVPEFTSRGINARIEISGITTRGPTLHSPRGAVSVADIAAGGSHAALVLHDGSVFTWGIGSNGRLGHARTHHTQLTFDSDHPERVDAFREMAIRQISCGFSHSAVVGVNGELATWGSTVQGKLGVGLVEDKFEQFAPEPLLVKFPGKRLMRSVSCGAAHTGAVSTQGELFMWGSANGGRLGLGPHVKDAVVVPTLVKDLVSRKVRVWQVACGNAHSALCTETTSELNGGSKKLKGGHVYVCGGAIPLGRYVPSWELVASLSDASVAIRQVSCGVAHTAAVSAYGELYTWGRNARGCTGHRAGRAFVAEPELVRSLHIEPFNLALGRACHQINVYNEQDAARAVNGDVDGALAKCTHTHLEEKPWWEVDLGQPAVIERIRVWNRTDEPGNPTKSRAEYTGRLFPFWILVSEFPFRRDLEGKEGLRAAKVQSSVFEQFDENKRMTEWVLPTAQTVGQYVRIQLQGRNFLHLAEVEVFGVYSAFNYVGRVGAAHCGNEATLVVVPPLTTAPALDDYYLRAVQADADSATVLRQFEAYEASYRRFARGDAASLGTTCRLCRVFRECEVCAFLAHAYATKASASDALPRRPTGDRAGLDELVARAVDESALAPPDLADAPDAGPSTSTAATAGGGETTANAERTAALLLKKVAPLRKLTLPWAKR